MIWLEESQRITCARQDYTERDLIPVSNSKCQPWRNILCQLRVTDLKEILGVFFFGLPSFRFFLLLFFTLLTYGKVLIKNMYIP